MDFSPDELRLHQLSALLLNAARHSLLLVMATMMGELY